MRFPFNSGVYCLENISNGKRYVGQSTNLYKRLNNYKNLKCIKQPKLYSALKKYGFDKFKVTILLYAADKFNLDNIEQHYIRKFNCIRAGYNCSDGGSNGRHSDESKLKMSVASKGRHGFWSGKKRPGLNVGMRKSAQARKRMSDAKIGKKVSRSSTIKSCLSKLHKSLEKPNLWPFLRKRIESKISNYTKELFTLIHKDS